MAFIGNGMGSGVCRKEGRVEMGKAAPKEKPGQPPLTGVYRSDMRQNWYLRPSMTLWHASLPSPRPWVSNSFGFR